MSRLAGAICAFVVSSSLVCGAGEIKIHEWPLGLPETLDVNIPVLMDIPLVPKVIIRSDPVVLKRVGLYTYRGCSTLQVECNFDLVMQCSITPTGAIRGDYSCSLGTHTISAPGGTTTLCAELRDAVPGGEPGGRITVAFIRIRVMAR